MNPYKVLKLDPDADKHAVKKAYFKLIRQYTPEKYPEKFKEIREAYEYLQEETNLVSMQKVQAVPKEFEKPYYQVLDWMKKEEYEKAVSLCERVLGIADIFEFRILLGNAYIRNDNSGKAVKLWEKICEENKENTEYMEQLGDAYHARGWGRKAFSLYYRLYEMKVQRLDFYSKLIELAVEQEQYKALKEISDHVLVWYRQLKKHSREDAKYMSDSLTMIIDVLSSENHTWILENADDVLHIISEQPMEFDLYAEPLLFMYINLILIWEYDEMAEAEVLKYKEYISLKKNSIPKQYEYHLVSAQCILEERNLRSDESIHDIILETSKYWYGLLHDKMQSKILGEFTQESELMEMLEYGLHDNSKTYDTLLYMVNELDKLRPSLELIKKEYPYLSQAMGEYLEEMLRCNNTAYLFQKYEKKYKKLMGYPVNARLSLSENEMDIYDSYENGTYKREGAKIGRNDPCPCGSGKKYKQCCGK
ncbi:MAG: DnaJ domain-containing protein [Velocimicrobium sp.]